MLVYLEPVAWRMLAAIAYYRPSLVLPVFAATLAVSAAMFDRPTVSSSPDLSGLIGQLSSHPSGHKKQKRVHAVKLAPHQTIRDINGDSLQISALATKLMTSAAAVKQPIRSAR
jgi:hypothetical protein